MADITANKRRDVPSSDTSFLTMGTQEYIEYLTRKREKEKKKKYKKETD